MFGSRPNFGSGAPSSFGGFGSTNTSTTGFGSSSSFGRPVFGTPQTTSATPLFGTGTATGTSSLFGQSQPTTGGLFGSSQPSTFGSSGFGSGSGGLFGSANTQPSSTGGLFGSTTSSGFNANQNQSRPFSFGTATTSSGATGPSLFGTNTSTGGTSLFSSSIPQQPGTVVKYSPVTGTDTMMRSGVSQNIQTKIEVITAMKEYEHRSLEELRLEDYVAGRKGPQQQQGFGFGQMGQQNKFMNQPASTSNWLGQSNTGGGLFGTKPQETKPLFGSGQTTGFGTSTAATGGLFGSSNPSPFGQATTAPSTGFSFGQNQNKPTGFGTSTSGTGGLFGSSNPSPFGQATTAPSTGFSFGQNQNKPTGFGTTTANTGGLFGSSNASPFGQANTLSSGFSFGQNKPAFGTSTASTGLFGSNTTPFGQANTSLSGGFSFGQNKPAGSTAPAFGTGGLFGSNQNAPKPGGLTFGAGTGFGTSTSSGFSFNQPSTGGGLFNNPPGGGGLFGNTGNTLNTGSTFGNSGGFGFGGGQMGQQNLMGSNMNFGNNNVVNNNNINSLIKALTHNPFGASSLLKTAALPTGKADELLNAPTNAPSSPNNSNTPNKASVSDRTPTYVLPSGTGPCAARPKVKPARRNGSLNSNLTDDLKKDLLFAGLDDKLSNPGGVDAVAEDPFRMKAFPSVKKLNLKVFKGAKSGTGSGTTGQSTASNSIVNGNLNSGTTSSLTNPLTSPGPLESPPNRDSITPLQESSPTPDIIKGRGNMKRLLMPNKNIGLNDTLADLNVVPASKVSMATADGAATSHDVNEANKENNMSLNISVFDPPSMEECREDGNNGLSSPHPAGIKLNRAGYYTIPSMDDLAEMIDNEGRCYVENFTVGRFGYGNICFNGVTDVAGLDLDTAVVIVRKEVEVYPEGVDKPPVGEELNKPAFITLDCVWPVDKTTHEVIKCQDRLDAIGWPQYLEKQCLKMEATFVEYRPETGSWVFKVKHFSKYGLQEDENEPPQALAPQSDPAMGKLPPLPTQTPVPIVDARPKTPLALSNYPATIPILGGRPPIGQGPPAMGLSSPPHQVPTEMISTPPVMRKFFLDGSTADVIEDEIFESGAVDRDQVDAMGLCPLSPSAERLTLTSRAPPRAMQTLKSQLFFGDLEEEETMGEDLGGSSKGVKRGEVSMRLDATVETPSGLLSKGPSSYKRLLIGQENLSEEPPTADVTRRISSFDDVISRVVPIAVETTSEKFPQKASFSPSICDVRQPDAEKDQPLLRDPRTEYPLLPPGPPEPSFELENIVPSHLGDRIPLKDSLISKTPKGAADFGAIMGRSFRVGWGPRLTLVHAGMPLGYGAAQNEDEEEDTPAGTLNLFSGAAPGVRSRSRVGRKTKSSKCESRLISVEKLHLVDDYVSRGQERGQIDSILEACLQTVLECSNSICPEAAMDTDSSIDIDIGSAPTFGPSYFAPKDGHALLHRLYLTASQIELSEQSERKLSLVFDLCVALWGRLEFYSPDDDGDSTYAMEQARKEALSVWLEEVSEETVANETERALLSDAQEAYLDAVFSHLTARQISKACDVCYEKGDHHLAMLLSQSCLGDETPRQIMSEQLSNWAWAGLDAHIPAQRLALYSLAAGRPTHESSVGLINTCLGLDWRRCLAILMWYVCPTTASIAEVVREYEEASGLSDSQSIDAAYCEEPKPTYLAQQPLPEKSKVNYDVCFQLLQLYVNRSHPLERLLATSGYTPDTLDVSTSWMLWCILQSLGYTLLSSAKAEALHNSMAALLEAKGSWHWAAFIILCIPDKRKREADLLALLSRHLLVEGEAGCADAFYREKEHFILKELSVPLSFVQSAKVVRAKSLGLVDAEAWYCIEAGLYNQAHEILLKTIAPNAVINEDHEFLLAYLKEFEKDEVKEQVTDWQNGGGIYLAYLEVIEQVNELRESRQPTPSKVEKLRPRLMALCLRLNNIKCETSVHRLCVSEMSRMVVSVLRAILSEDPDGVRVLAQQVSALPLTQECALEELNHITHQYLASLSNVAMETT